MKKKPQQPVSTPKVLPNEDPVPGYVSPASRAASAWMRQLLYDMIERDAKKENDGQEAEADQGSRIERGVLTTSEKPHLA